MYKISEAFHKQYAYMYDKFVRIYLKDGSMRIGLFNDEFYEDISILVSCEVIKITDIEKMELFEEQPWSYGGNSLWNGIMTWLNKKNEVFKK